MGGLEASLSRIANLTTKDIQGGKRPSDIIGAAIEELGEVSRANRVENGVKTLKNKQLKETAVEESVDLIVSSIAVFCSLGGDLNKLPAMLHNALDKYEFGLTFEEWRKELESIFIKRNIRFDMDDCGVHYYNGLSPIEVFLERVNYG